MKKVLVALLSLVVVACSACLLVACGNNGDEGGQTDVTMAGYDPATDGAMKVAMITDYGDITDQSFNQTTYEACKEFCGDSIGFKYYKPTGDSTEARVASVEQAITEGYNVIVMPGYAFGETVANVAGNNPKVTFIALDVAAGDLGEGYVVPGNVATFVYQEELSGFMAGYAAVKDGYRKLGFLGGMAVPAVIRFGYGFVQGANTAAVEMGIDNSVSIEYVYGGQFFGDAAITAVMDTWYAQKKVEVVFACGGGIFTSACEAATKEGINGKVIGVDSDQSYAINGTGEGKYGEGVCITSAMKGLAPTVKSILTAIKDGNWKDYYGKISNLGLVSGTELDKNYVQLPTETWSMTNFTVDDYKALVYRMEAGIYNISNATDAMPAHKITVNTYDQIK